MGLADLIAGDRRAILLAIEVDDWASLDDGARFDAHLTLGGGFDPTWLDRFSEAIRSVRPDDRPRDFIDARVDLEGTGANGAIGDRVVEGVERTWIDAVADVPDGALGAVAARWIDLLEQDDGDLPSEEKPTVRQVAAQLVDFARAARQSPDVVFAWAL
jgi:hypothetical protein